eukprot:TRINITY_DN11700_c0_g1_i1.p1 TRINITY_DN11700_c0_g1~~TRINITY_DN11700_c0_g1_i1.p1  ORF type:complete len:963 (-),score=174.62 TRINITY_DN11700_c0_g1_i1:574-3081(-)
MVLAHRVFGPRGPEGHATCIAAFSRCASSSSTTGSLRLVAAGTRGGTVQLFRGQDLTQERPYPITLVVSESENGVAAEEVTSVEFLDQSSRIVLFACTASCVRSWSVLDQSGGQEVRQLLVDAAGGAGPACACSFPPLSALLVARADAVFAYDPEEGNMSAMPIDGEKSILQGYKSYIVAVMADTTQPMLAGGFGSSAPPSSMPKQSVMVVFAHKGMRFIAYAGQFTDVVHVTVAMDRVFVLSRGGSEANTVLFELREKPLAERLDTLVKKRMFEWAAEVALKSDAAPEVVSDIYRQHGDALFEKRAYDQALAVYSKTVDLGKALEPSYVVERYLDAQRIGHVAQYLKKIHEQDLAEPEHTALLLKCYTKLKDVSTLREFLEKTPPSQYDPSTAIEVLESACYYDLAASVAKKVGRNDDYARISLEQFENYSEIVDFLRTLNPAECGRTLLAHGRLLLRHVPAETLQLVRQVCGLSATGRQAAGSEPSGPSINELLPIFVDDEPQLIDFLRAVLLDRGCQLPQAQAEQLFPTLLELLVRSHRDLSASEDSDAEKQEAASKLGADIMRLVRQFPSDSALANTLMVCQTYGFVDGFFHAAERLHRHQLLMNWCFQHRDGKRLLEVCRRCGSVDQSLWVQALSFLTADKEGGHLEEIAEVLRHIEDSDLMPLLMVIETLQQSQEVTIGEVRPYLQAQYRRMVEPTETSRSKAAQDRQEIDRMQQEIIQLRTQAKEFQSSRCFQCNQSPLEVPAVHFFCGHSYHSYCVPADGSCPKCSSEALPKLSLKDQREAQARNAEDFFKYLQGGAGDRGLQAMADWCKYGAFDAAAGLAQEEDED